MQKKVINVFLSNSCNFLFANNLGKREREKLGITFYFSQQDFFKKKLLVKETFLDPEFPVLLMHSFLKITLKNLLNFFFKLNF